jgi:hypothetical protein
LLALSLFWHGQTKQSFNVFSSKSVFDSVCRLVEQADLAFRNVKIVSDELQLQLFADGRREAHVFDFETYLGRI